MKTIRLLKDHWRGLAVVPVFLAGILAIMATTPPGPVFEDVSKPFVLSYVDTSFRLRIRWSDDGMNWNTPSAVATPMIDRAPGIAANTAGVVYLAIFDDAASDARFITGIGPDTWDSTTTLVGNGYRPEIQSGTSITYISGQNWATAFRRQNSAKLRMFDMTSTVRDFGPEITPVIGTINNSVSDKPAIVNMNGTVLMSWLMNDQLQMVTGTVQGDSIAWDAGYRFDQTVVETGFGPPEGAHDLASDGTNFYLAVVRQRDPMPGEQLQRHFLFVYTSTNGLNWTLLNSDQQVRLAQSLGLAARGTDDILAMVSVQATQLPPAFVHHFDGSNWSDVDPDDVFGTNPMNQGHDFTLYARH